MDKTSSGRAKKTSQPSEAAGGDVAFPALPVEVIDAYTQLLLQVAGELPLPMLSMGERRLLRPAGAAAKEASDSVGALRFSPQVVRHTGVTPELLEEALGRREALLLLRDAALQLARSASDGIALLDQTSCREGRALLAGLPPGAEESEEVRALRRACGPAAEAVSATPLLLEQAGWGREVEAVIGGQVPAVHRGGAGTP